MLPTDAANYNQLAVVASPIRTLLTVPRVWPHTNTSLSDGRRALITRRSASYLRQSNIHLQSTYTPTGSFVSCCHLCFLDDAGPTRLSLDRCCWLTSILSQ